MGVPCGFCSRCWALSVLWYQQKEMQFGIEMREHGALPKPTPEMVCAWGISAHGEKAKGETVAWGELHPGPYSSSPGWGLSHRAAGRFTYFPSHSHGAPHLSAAVSETAWPPAASLLCRAAAEQRRTPALLPHRRSGASSAGESRGTITLPGNHLPAASSCQQPVPARTRCHGAAVGQRRGSASLCPSGSICFAPGTVARFAGPASSGTGQDMAAPQSCTHARTHVRTPAPAGRLPSHSEADCRGFRVIHEALEIRSHRKGCGFPG